MRTKTAFIERINGMRRPAFGVAFLLLFWAAQAFPQSAVISVSPPSLTFNAFQSGALPASQTVDITNTGGGSLNWSAFRARNSFWLSLVPTVGTAPGTVTVSITATGLAPNTYYDTILVYSAGANNSPQRVPVTYTVSVAPTPAVISVSPASLTFNAFQSGALPASQTLDITNTGSGTLNWTAAEARNSGWLNLVPTNGTAPGSITVTITTTGLVPNTYYDTIVVSSADANNSPQRVPVTYAVSAAPTPAVISLSPASFTFNAFQSGALPASQTLDITNTGSGTLNWTAAEALNSGWLNLVPTNGTAPGSITVSITATGLAPNTYYDTIVVSSADANNSPQRVPVTYTVSAAPTPAVISLSPDSLTFNAFQTGALPAFQTVDIANTGSGALNWTAFRARNSIWLSLAPSPTEGTAPSTITVSITTTSLVPNTYYDTIVVFSADAGNSPQQVPVTYILTGPSIFPSPDSLLFSGSQGGPNPAGQILSIDATSPNIAWSVSKSQSWLGLTPVADTGSGQVSVSASLAGLVEGDYFDSIVVTAPQAVNSPRQVPVHLHVEGPVLSSASLQVSPDSLDFDAQRNQPIPPQSIDISNGGQLPLNWTAAVLHGAAWLAIDPSSGTDGGTITVTVTTDLDPLTYVDTIKIEAPDALNSPRFIPVRLNVTTDAGDGPANRPRSFALFQNYPNPFNPATKIDFALPRSGYARLEVFNVVGQRIRVLVDGELSAGLHSVVWDGRESSGQLVGSGIYFYRLKSENLSDIKRAVFLK
ncbi:MAG: T9SS type A sorting domain-containing protein [candidate division Zixibacteria bacterium]|nr:T9SS type A sorting domain-containing protein [candidate division Zixibacteria bacterium]